MAHELPIVATPALVRMELGRERPIATLLHCALQLLVVLSVVYAQSEDIFEESEQSSPGSCYRPVIDEDRLQDHACTMFNKVCIDQGRFVMFADEMRPGRTFWRDDIFDITQTADGPFYNVPGYLDNFKGTKKAYRTPHFRGNSSADFHDILSPQFDDCSVPLVWWPWWPFNPGDFFLSSLAPFHAMLNEGVIDRNVRYTPVLEGLTRPGYFQWYFDPITHFPIRSLEELSDRSNVGKRCYERILLCKPYSIWFLSPGREWHDGLMYGTLGQEIVEFQSSRGGLTDVEKPNDLFRIAFIERKHKRRIVNFEELVASCNLWQLPEGTKYKRVECWAINLDSSDKYLENISQLRSVDALVGMHGAGLINHNFMKPNSSFIEILPCQFGGEWHDYSFQVPSKKQNIVFAWKIQAYNPVHCHPSRLESHTYRPDLSTEEWATGSLKRDQDLTVDLYQLGVMLGRIASMGGDRDQYQEKAWHDPDYLYGAQ